MSSIIGEIDYNGDEMLYLGADYNTQIDRGLKSAGGLEMHLIDKKDQEEFTQKENLEASLIADIIEKLIDSRYGVYDRNIKGLRKISYRDIAVLSRSTVNMSAALLDEFKRRNIPAYSDGGSTFFQTIEIKLICSYLKAIDNPLNDIPLVSILRSPIYRFSSEDLGKIRLYEDEEQILELSRDPVIYDKIVSSVAPSIYGYEDIKEALALQLFSGVVKNLPDGSRIRGDIHVMLVGDPGIAKSQLLRYVVKLSPRGVFTSGRSASASGLTAAAVKDDLNDGRWTIEGGALVMADMGIAAVDEMDKMKTEDKSALHEAMEQQTISIAKAGIIATLKSRCALLGAANPKYGRFDRYEGLAEQINMPPALLSRFDLIFVLLDTPDHTLDTKIANHILQSHYAGELFEQREKLPGSHITEEFVEAEMEVIEPVIQPEIMRKYVAYARKNVFPVMEEDARAHLINFYTDLRKTGESKNTPVPVTARQLEALVRLSEASARVRLSNIVTLEDAKRTIRIVMNCLKNVGVDPDTGALDADILASGTSMSQRNKIKTLRDIIKKVSEKHPGAKAPLEEVYTVAESEHGIDRSHAEENIKKMKQRGDLLSPDQNHIRLV